ncbi:MAG: hypothetical protein JNG90_17420 [Planctomycetaceae bacterium]|nr:hypothetical protein [Planctomycetaceae bacterium]
MSLRALLLAVTCCALALGWTAHRATRQRDLIRSLAGGRSQVYYDFQVTADGALDPRRASPLPAWLVHSLGLDLWHDVAWIRLAGCEVTDATLAAVARLPHVEELHLVETSVSEGGLAALAQMRGLKVLTLNTPEVGDALVAQLAELPELRELEIFSALVTDRCVERLADCGTLERLWFEDTEVTERALEDFRVQHPNCRAGYSSPGFKTIAWRPRSLNAPSAN